MNYTGKAEQRTFEDMQCTIVSTEELYNHLIFFSAVKSILSITAFLGNTLILVALHKESSLHPPSKLLLRSLATTDLCVGTIVQPLYATYFLSLVNERWNICRNAIAVVNLTGYTLSLVSLVTLTTISVDRLIALLLGLRYRQVVTFKRMCLTVALSWVVCAIGSTLHLWNHRIT